MKKLMMVFASMLLLVNLVGCGSNNESKEPAKQEQKQEQKVKEEKVFHFGYEQFGNIEEVENAIKSDLEKGGVGIVSEESEGDEYGTTFAYTLEFEHDIDEDGFDWSDDTDYYIYYTIDNETLELLDMEIDATMVTNIEGINEDMKVVAETFLKYYGTIEAQEQLQEQWNTHRDMTQIEITNGEGTTGDELAIEMYFCVDPTAGVMSVYVE